MEEEKVVLFIARLAKRGACLTEGETTNDGELSRSWSDDELNLIGLELQIGVTPHLVNWTAHQTIPILTHMCGGERKEGTTPTSVWAY